MKLIKPLDEPSVSPFFKFGLLRFVGNTDDDEWLETIEWAFRQVNIFLKVDLIL